MYRPISPKTMRGRRGKIDERGERERILITEGIRRSRDKKDKADQRGLRAPNTDGNDDSNDSVMMLAEYIYFFQRVF